jgi:hypothetical protein
LGGTANPALSITKNNATAGFIYEPKSIIGRNVLQNEELYRMSVLGNTPTLANQEFARIEVSCTTLGATGNDGTIDFWSSVNGTISEVFRMNGADNENNSFRPLDMNGQDVKSSSGNMVITTTSSTGTGTLNINAKNTLTLASATDNVAVSNNLTMATDKTISLSDNAPHVTATTLGNGALVINDITTSDTATLTPQALSFGISAPSTTTYSPTGFFNSDNSICCNTSNGFYLNYGSAVNRTNLDLSTFEMYNTSGNLIDQILFQNNGAGNPVFNILSTDNTTGILTPILKQAGISNQGLGFTYTDVPAGTSTSLQLTNTTGGSGTLSYTNTIDSSPLQITSNKSIELNTAIDLILGGASLQSNSSTGSSGQYLRIFLNGSYYKIALDND